MIKDKKLMKVKKTPSRRKFFKAAAATGDAAVAASSLAAPAVAKDRIEVSMVATWGRAVSYTHLTLPTILLV